MPGGELLDTAGSDRPSRTGSELVARCFGFAAAVARYCGLRGLTAWLFVALGAALEGMGILLLVPLLAALFDQASLSSLPYPLARLESLLPGWDPLRRLAAVLAAF